MATLQLPQNVFHSFGETRKTNTRCCCMEIKREVNRATHNAIAHSANQERQSVEFVRSVCTFHAVQPTATSCDLHSSTYPRSQSADQKCNLSLNNPDCQFAKSCSSIVSVMILRLSYLPVMIHVWIIACFVFPDLDLSCLCLFADNCLLTIFLPHVSDY